MTTAFDPRLADLYLGSRHTNIRGPYFNWHLSFVVGRDSVVGTATRYGLDGQRIESREGRDFLHPSRPALGPTQPPLQWVPGPFSGVKRPGRGVHHPPQSKGEVKERVNLNLYSSSGSSWPLLGWSLPLPFNYHLSLHATNQPRMWSVGRAGYVNTIN